jgi:glycine betaine/choline ABC-type transport system substrate-binding protein
MSIADRQQGQRSKEEVQMTRRTLTALVAALAAVLAVAGCGSSSNDKSSGSANTGTTASPAATSGIQKNPANGSKPTITVGSKNFTEEFILGEIYAQALQAAGYKVKKQLNLGSEQIAYKALKAGKVGAYPEYTGTALTSFFKVPTNKVPKNAQAAYRQAKADYAKQRLAALPPTPFTDSNGFAITQATSKKLGGVTTLSGLKPKASTLTIAGAPECRQREDCLLGLQHVYGLKFKKFIPIDLTLKYDTLLKGKTDVTEVFTTDGQIKANKLVLLADDKHLFPPYNVTFVVRDNVLKSAGPDLAKTVTLVQKGLTTPVMQELNSRVDLDKQKPAAVAHQYLTESHLLPGT